MSRDRHSAIVGAVRTLCDPYDVSVEYGIGGKHAYVILTHPDGRWVKEPIAWSPNSSGNQIDWARQSTRRTLKAWGIDTPADPQPHRERHRRVGGGMPRQCPDSPSKLTRDPWEALSVLYATPAEPTRGR